MIMRLPVENQNFIDSLNQFFRSLLEQKIIDALLVTQKTTSDSYTKVLIKKPEEVINTNPFAPIMIENSAKFVSALTAWPIKEKIGAVLRPCEMRTVIELAKFKQTNLENLLLIGVDCPGTIELDEYKRLIGNGKKIEHLFGSNPSDTDLKLRVACRVCLYPIPQTFDVAIGIFGMDLEKEILIQTDEKRFSKDLGLEQAASMHNRETIVASLIATRRQLREGLLKILSDKFSSIDKLIEAFSLCRNCHSCRIACPICYCPECIFFTPVFAHRSEQFLKWAQRKGKIKMPYQTILYHLTRLNHMVTSCVECGECSSACPNGLPVFELFLKVGIEVRKLFDYNPGLDPDEPPPVATFKESELQTIGGV